MFYFFTQHIEEDNEAFPDTFLILEISAGQKHKIVRGQGPEFM